MSLYLQAFRKCLNFKGRARRREYWTFFFVHFTIILLFISMVNPVTPDSPPMGLLALTGRVVVLFYFFVGNLAGFAVSIRRLHDTNRSGFWMLLVFVPFGGLVAMFFMLLDSDPLANKFGQNPKIDDGELVNLMR